MDTLALKLPGHLYTEPGEPGEPGEPDSTEYKLVLDAERIVAWYDHGRGVHKLCQQIYEHECHAIDHWEDEQSLLLDEQWMSLENGVDDDENEAQYALAGEAVASEARDRRDAARARRQVRESRLEKLVQESIDHLEAHRPATTAGSPGGFMLLLAAGAALLFMLLA